MLQSEQAVHFHPEWCRVRLASIGDAVIITDTEGRVTFLNSVAEYLTGWTPQEAVGQPLDSVFCIINEESRQPVENPAVPAWRDGVVVGLDNQSLLVANDGTERAIDYSAAPIEHGEVGGMVLVFRDSSERKRQEQQVQAALAYAENIIATVREPFLVLDRDLRVVTANRSFYENFHVTPEETQGCFIYDLGNRQWDIPRLRLLLEEILPQDHQFHDFQVEYDFPTIGRKIVLLNARRIREPGNQAELILLAIEDITERNQAEVAMRTSEVRYRRLFETARDGILILDAHTGQITEVNPFMTELLGYGHDDFMGKELWQIGLFKDKSANEAAFRELQQHGYIRYDHLPLEAKSGKRVEVEFVSNVYQVNHQHVVQCNIRDIGDRSRLEKQTQQQAAELADLHRRKDEFLAMLGHELRNPLAPIMNAVLLLRPLGSENPTLQLSRSIIERQVGQLTRLVDDLLEVSRITTGRIHLHQEHLDMRGVVERAVETGRPLFSQHQHILTVRLSPQPIWVNADAARLEQVVVNLLNNAAKYSKDHSHIFLGLQQDGAEAVLRVRDEGVGIAAELLPRIFDLFTQAERSLDRSQGGLGLGLALVRQLVEMHGGRVEVHSSLGEGSEFVVRLPVVAAPAPLPPTTATEAAQPTESLRVLVVDDNKDGAESLAMLVKESGHDVRTAYDGPSALQAALQYRPSVVLIDIGLPEMSGYEVAKRIRHEPTLQKVVLVAVTGYGREADRQTSLEAGFNHHLVKPAAFKNVQQILATVSERAT